VVVRAALLPLTFKQFKSTQALAYHAPEMKKLQDRYKHDKERLNQEMMKFYRENKINPFASCLPLLAQLPVFLSLFYMLQKDLRIDICGQSAQPCGPGEASFWFINDLTDKASGAELAILIVLYIGSQLFSTLLMSTTTDRTQRLIFLALPFVFVVFVINFPAGLLVYWITTNLWTIVQQAIVRKRLGPLRPPSADGEGGPMSIMDRMLHRGSAQPPPSSSPSRAPVPAVNPSGGNSKGNSAPKSRPAAPPPRSPRKKKKRSGRRR
jgi:YidC/Oxa1 family membrane protein insertase